MHDGSPGHSEVDDQYLLHPYLDGGNYWGKTTMG